MTRNRNLAKAFFSAAILGLPLVGQAQVSGTWLNPLGGSWNDPLNWNSNPQIPGGGGTATFPASTWAPIPILLSSSSISLTAIKLNGPAPYVFSGSPGTLSFSGPALVEVGGPAAQPAWVSPFSGTSSLRNISTTAGFIKSGAGGLMTAGFFTITGGLTINEGALISGGNYPLSISNGTLILNGGEFRTVDGGPAAAMPVAIGPAGGKLSGSISTFTLSNNLTGSSTLTLESLSSSGFQGGGSSTFSGLIDAKTALRLTGQGALPSAGEFRLADNLVLNNGAGTVVNNRIDDTAPISIRGGGISGSGTSSNPITESLGTVTLERGLNTIGSNQYLGLTLAGLTRADRTVLSTGTAIYSLQLNGALPPLAGSGSVGTSDVGILPWARWEGSVISPVTIDAGSVRNLTSSEFITTLPTGVTTSNLKVDSDATLTSPATVNSLTIAPSGFFLSLNGASTLSVTSGAVFVQSPPIGQPNRTIIGIPLAFGSAEGVLHTNLFASGQVDFTGPISGSNGVTVAGGLSLRGANTYTGQTTILSKLNIFDNVVAGLPGPLGVETAPAVIEGAMQGSGITFYPAPGATLQFNRDLTINTHSSYGSVTLALGSLTGGDGSAVISSNIQVNGALGLIGAGKPGPNGYIFSGNISGPGRLVNPTNVTLTGSNSFSGGVVHGAGTLVVGNNSALGTGTIWFTNVDGVRLNASSPVTLSNPIVISGAARFGGSQPLTLAGPIDFFGGVRTIFVENTAATTITSEAFNGGMSKSGAGLLRMSRARMGTFNVNSGVVQMLPNGTNLGTSRLNSLSISAASFAQLDLTDNDLILDYSAAAAAPAPPATIIKDHLAANRLVSSTGDGIHTGLGYADNSVLGLTSFDGQPIDPSTMLIKYTFRGDSNLDDVVDIRDLTALAINYYASGSKYWSDGDFNYDGHVTIADLALLAQNWQAGAGAPALAAAMTNLGLPNMSIPEPGATSLLGMPFLMLFRRSRSRKRR